MYKVAFFVVATALISTSAQAQDSLQQVSNALGESVVSTGHLSEAGVKVVGGSIAAPLMLAGSVAAVGGSAVAEAGSDLWQSANAPLEVSPETLIGQPVPQVPYEAPKTTPVKTH